MIQHLSDNIDVSKEAYEERVKLLSEQRISSLNELSPFKRALRKQRNILLSDKKFEEIREKINFPVEKYEIATKPSEIDACTRYYKGNLGPEDVDILNNRNGEMLIIEGNINFSDCKNFKKFPKYINIIGNVNLEESSIKEIKDCYISGNLNAKSCEDLVKVYKVVVGGSVILDYSNVEEIKDCYISGDLKAKVYTRLRNLSNVNIGGSAYLDKEDDDIDIIAYYDLDEDEVKKEPLKGLHIKALMNNDFRIRISF